MENYAVMRNYPKVLISSFDIPLPSYQKERTSYFDISEEIFKNENIGTILNVANGTTKKSLHDELYSKYSINYIFLGIDDGPDIPENFLDNVVKIYEDHVSKTKDKAFLVNCHAGINRSALAIGAILWRTRLNYSTDLCWETPEEMIQDMRWFQKRDRNLDALLLNKNFEMYLINYCNS